MANDPTARHAQKAVAASGMTRTITIDDNEPVRISEDTLRTIMSLLEIQYSPSHGAYFATVKARP